MAKGISNENQRTQEAAYRFGHFEPKPCERTLTRNGEPVALVSATYVFNSHLIADAYFGYSRINMFSNQPNQDKNLGYTLLGIPGLSTAGLSQKKQLEHGALPNLLIDGFTNLGPR
jgi:hypothetical protein